MPYAWDEPALANRLRVQAKVVGRSTDARVADYFIDYLGDKPMLALPTHGSGPSGQSAHIYRTLSRELPDQLKQKLVSLLAAEFSKKACD
jgi:hypothetical protein